MTMKPTEVVRKPPPSGGGGLIAADAGHTAPLQVTFGGCGAQIKICKNQGAIET